LFLAKSADIFAPEPFLFCFLFLLPEVIPKDHCPNSVEEPEAKPIRKDRIIMRSVRQEAQDSPHDQNEDPQ
jgi:hypothetical protein